MQQTILETPRLHLKELTPEIMATLFSIYSDDRIMDFLGISAEELKKERHDFGLGMTTYRLSFKNFLIAEKTTGRIIGRCGYHTWYLLHARAEMGYALHNDADKNKGYMKEAIKTIIAHGFEHMQLNRIEALVGPRNEPSLKLVRGLGFTEEGLLRAHYLKNGVYQDSVFFGLLRTEYDKRTW